MALAPLNAWRAHFPRVGRCRRAVHSLAAHTAAFSVMPTDGGDAKRARLGDDATAARPATAATPAADQAGKPRYDVNYKAATPESLRATLGEPLRPNPLQLRVDGQDGRARACTLLLPHGPVHTPVFMPVGTKGTIKCLTSEQVEAAPLGCEIILGNTYHLGNYPGPEVLRELGGLHKLMNWKRNLLTDSGGFQMVSLFDLAEITEEGVRFKSPVDGSMMMLTPEKSMDIQNAIGADIMMMLDDVVSSKRVDYARFSEAADRTVRWLDRCILGHNRQTEQALFAIVQGGLDCEPGGLRDRNLKDLMARSEYLGGFAIGGLAGGETKEQFWPVVDMCTPRLPKDKPIYCMGVGYALDLVVCVALGVDMFDCVYPTRTARFGVALVDSGTLRLKQSTFSDDERPIDDTCTCIACKNYSRAALRMLFLTENTVGPQAVTAHNIAYMMRLVRDMRAAILDGKYADFTRGFLAKLYPDGDYPQWSIDALASAGISVGGGAAAPASSAESAATAAASVS